VARLARGGRHRSGGVARRSLMTTTRSRSSRRALPIQRSATPFCQGLRGAVRLGFMTKKSMAAVASRWLRRKVIQRLPLSPAGGFGYDGAMRLMAMLVGLLGACSFGMRGVDPKWDGTREPECDQRVGPPIADGVIAAGLAVGAVNALILNSQAMTETDRDATNIVAGAFAATAVLFLISSSYGAGRRSTCIAAKRQWEARNPTVAPAAVATSPGRAPAGAPAPSAPAPGTPAPGAPAPGTPAPAAPASGAPAPGAPAPGAPAPATPAPSTPAPATTAAPPAVAAPVASAGATSPASPPVAPAPPAALAASFFCTSSPSRPALNVCLPDSATCEHARQTLAVDDLTACAPAPTAWCFDVDGKPRCLGTLRACNAQRDKAAATATPCAERRR
jgi:hypothetical protein